MTGMATLYFGRNGNDPNRASAGIDVSIQALSEALGRFDKRFTGEEPPVVNPGEKAHEYGPYTLTVVHVESKDTNPTFPKSGYYWFPELPPESCAELLGLEMPDR